MVRLLGKINETALVPTHDKIIRSGELLAGTGGIGSGATVEINTGFHSVMLAWFTTNMKQAPGPNATLGPTPHLYPSDTPTYGATIVAAFSTVGVGYATLEWFAMGDL